tara:strand:+ start:534 stop:638 length:105 start_codon:yes stop_codon:yes gene_type:complete
MLGLFVVVDFINSIKKAPIEGKKIKEDKMGKFIN